MTPERKAELDCCQDAVNHAKYTLDRKNYVATITAQEERIKELASLLAESANKVLELHEELYCGDPKRYPDIKDFIDRVDAILPKTEEVK